MQSCYSIRQLRNRKRQNTARATTSSENNGSESHSAMKFCRTNENEEPKIRSLTQEEVIEQIKNFIATLTRQLEDLTRVVQGL